MIATTVESAVQINCRCGQPFTVLNERFPHRVRCHACARQFYVMDNASLISADDDLDEARPQPKIDSTAIQNETSLLLTSGSTNITQDPTPDTIHIAYANLDADLREIDLLWVTERKSHSLIPLPDVTMLPSKSLSLGVGLTLAGFSFLMFGLAIGTGKQGWICPGMIGAATFVFLPIYIFTRTLRLEKAEAVWLRKRALAIAKSGLPADAAEGASSPRVG